MKLIIVRHAIAEERDFDHWPDDRGRPLTTDGRKRFRTVARLLSRVGDAPKEVWSSPLSRAWETAEILQEEARWPAPSELTALEPGADPAETLIHIRKRRSVESIAVVGHEPHLHELLSLLLSGSTEGAQVEMKKGGAALIEFEGTPTEGSGRLLWVLPPRVLLTASGSETASR